VKIQVILKIPSFMPTLKEIAEDCAEDAAMEVLKLQKENIKG
jgi:hypothetical protein